MNNFNETDKIELSIIIVTWNVKHFLRKCLKTIYENIVNINFEIIITDNASDDGTVSMVKEEFSQIHILENRINLGFPKANNHALKFAKGKYVLFLNPDTEIINGSIDKMMCFLKEYNHVAAVGCKLIYPDGNLQNACARSFPTPLNQFYELIMLTKLFPKNKYLGSANLSYWDHNDTREVDCLSGACMMVKREILESIGGFSEDYFMYAEDIDLCYRIKVKGYKIYFIGEVVVLHHEGKSSEQKWQDQGAILKICEAKKRFMENMYGYHIAFLYKTLVIIGASFRIFVIVLLMALNFIEKKIKYKVSSLELKRYMNYLSWGLQSYFVNRKDF